MKSMSTTRPELPRRQAGFALVAAVFILVVLAGLAGYLVSTSATQNLTLAQGAMNARAALAARAGIEWAAYQVTRTVPPAFKTACDAVGYNAAVAPVPATQVFAAGDLAGLGEFQVDITCRSQSYAEAGSTYRVYQLTATACSAAPCPATSPPPVGYVEHRQTATVHQ